jgi:hypothetical protein
VGISLLTPATDCLGNSKTHGWTAEYCRGMQASFARVEGVGFGFPTNSMLY